MQKHLVPGGNQNKCHQIELFFRGYKYKPTEAGTELSTYLDVELNGRQIGKTETVPSNNKPRYDTTVVVDYVFERSQMITVKCMGHNGELLGECSFPLGALVGSKKNNLKVPMENTDGRMASGMVKVMYEGISSEQLKIMNSATPLVTRATFSEHLNGGLNMSVVVCMDFTVSNGFVNNKSSLHYISPNKLNDYQMAIASVCGILMNYDKDKKIPVYGFGAKPKFPNFNNNGRTSHFFPCSGNWSNCAATGIQDIFEIYSNCLNNVELSGPTYFEPLLEEVCKFADAGFQKNPRNYTVLLILTDGIIHDMEETVELVVQAAELPLSIIIVGVGNENFEDMMVLDDDNGRLMDEDGNKPSRDIIQFVEFNKFKNMEIGALAEEVLEELPEQVCSFMDKKGIVPKGNLKKHNSISEADDEIYYPQMDQKYLSKFQGNRMTQSTPKSQMYNNQQPPMANYMSVPRQNMQGSMPNQGYNQQPGSMNRKPGVQQINVSPLTSPDQGRVSNLQQSRPHAGNNNLINMNPMSNGVGLGFESMVPGKSRAFKGAQANQ